MFVHEDEIPDAVKFYHKFADDLEKAAKAAAAKGMEVTCPTELSCVVMDNKYLTPAEVCTPLGGLARHCTRHCYGANIWCMDWQVDTLPVVGGFVGGLLPGVASCMQHRRACLANVSMCITTMLSVFAS